MKPLACTKCAQQVTLVEHYVAHLDHGLAVVREDGVVISAGGVPEEDSKWLGDPFRVMAVCLNRECGHQWAVRRRVDFHEPYGETL